MERDSATELDTLLGTNIKGQHYKGLTLRRSVVVPMCVCYFIALGINMYVLPQYTRSALQITNVNVGACSINKSDPVYEEYTKEQQRTAVWMVYFTLSSSLPAIIGNLVWNSYSDIVGRRFAFCICVAGGFVRTAILTVVIYFKLNLAYIILGNVIDGASGSVMSLFAVLFSYVSDITRLGKQRTLFIIVFELVLGVTYTFVSIASGYLISVWGFFYPMLISCSMSLAAIVIVICLVPETHVPCNSHATSFFVTVLSSVMFYIKSESKTKRCKYILLLMSFTFMSISSLNRATLEILYQLGEPFCWGSVKIGWFGAVKILVCSLFGIGTIKLLQRCFADDTSAVLCMGVGVISYIVEGLATTNFVMYSVAVISMTSLLPFPLIRSLMSSLTTQDKQGALFASLGAMENFCVLVGALTNNMVYFATLSIMNGFVFILMAIGMVLGMLFLLGFMYVQRTRTDDVSVPVLIIPEVL